MNPFEIKVEDYDLITYSTTYKVEAESLEEAKKMSFGDITDHEDIDSSTVYDQYDIKTLEGLVNGTIPQWKISEITDITDKVDRLKRVKAEEVAAVAKLKEIQNKIQKIIYTENL